MDEVPEMKIIINRGWFIGISCYMNSIYLAKLGTLTTSTLGLVCPYYLVCVTLSLKGSNFTTIFLAALRLTDRNCLLIADTTPPDLRNVPLKGIDILFRF